MTDCPSEELLANLAAGLSHTEEAELIARHAERCDRCRNWLEQNQSNVAWVESVFGAARQGMYESGSEPAAGTRDAQRPAGHGSQEHTPAELDHSTIAGLVARGVLEPSSDARYCGRLGSYSITGYLGRGGMGTVLKAYEESLNRTVALKVLRTELADDELAVARFTREAKAAGTLRHPNIVTVYAVGQQRSVHFLAMEYVEGPTLAEVVRDSGPLPAERASDIFRQLLAGLSCAHEAGLIHRDIKAANILLEGSGGQVKIVDFGLARTLGARTRLTLGDSVLGTPEYMSPEQARGDESLDHRTDLYSAGIVLFEMLTGRTPFRADTPSAVIHRIMHEDPSDPQSIFKAADRHLASLALRLTAKRPEDRFDSAADALTALEAGAPVTSLARRRRRRRTLAVLGATGLAIAAAWLTSRVLEQSPVVVQSPIVKVTVHDAEDSQYRTCVEARRADGNVEECFYEFEEQSGHVTEAVIADLDGSGHQIVVAGVRRPIKGQCLFGIDASGQLDWGLDLSSNVTWPDCGPSGGFWCLGLVSDNLDGLPGDELVVVSTDISNYATRLSIVDPRTGDVRATFWHTGHINQVVIEPDFFGPGRPAIVARGANNILDGFDDGQRPAAEQTATYNYVTALMILDPMDMDGLGPPRAPRLPDFELARPYAYAFLNLAYVNNVARVPIRDDGRRVLEVPPDDAWPLEQIGGIGNIARRDSEPGLEARPWFSISINISEENDDGSHVPARALLTVDRHLALRHIEPTHAGGAGQPEHYWKDAWQVVIRNREYVDVE